MVRLKNDEANIYSYGLVRNQENRNNLLVVAQEKGTDTFPAIVNDVEVTVLKVQNEFVYCKGFYPHGICEYNKNLCILSNEGSARWRFLEIEYKINVLNKEEELYQSFCQIKLLGFSTTYLPQLFRSVETMFYPYPNCYFSLLKWEGEQNYNAIKIKKTISTSPFLSRDTLIIDYTPHRLSHVLRLFKIDHEGFRNQCATFIKKKQRHIVVDNEKGYVFGVSFNISKIQDCLFCQVEIEYWSKIIPILSHETLIHYDDTSQRIDSHSKLVEGVCQYLAMNGIKYDKVQLQKNIWLQRIATSTMR